VPAPDSDGSSDASLWDSSHPEHLVAVQRLFDQVGLEERESGREPRVDVEALEVLFLSIYSPEFSLGCTYCLCC
jgi:hypothetical protein